MYRYCNGKLARKELYLVQKRIYVNKQVILLCFQCNCCKVPLSVLLPRIEKLSIPPKRTNVVEQIKSDEDTFSVYFILTTNRTTYG